MDTIVEESGASGVSIVRLKKISDGYGAKNLKEKTNENLYFV